MVISPTQSNVTAALGKFLTDVLPNGTDVIVAVGNRVPQPASQSFVVMSPIRFERIETNQDTYQDVKFVGSISGATLTVESINAGTIVVGATIFGSGVAAGTTVEDASSGTGGVGTYVVDPAQTVALDTLSAGAKTIQQNAKITVQLDFHSIDTTAADAAQTVSTALRDEYGVDFFAGLAAPLNGVVPLYADDPKFMPFVDDSQQVEWRWTLDCLLQINQVISVPQQFADVVSVEAVSAVTVPAP